MPIPPQSVTKTVTHDAGRVRTRPPISSEIPVGVRLTERHGPESNRRIAVLQTAALPLGYRAEGDSISLLTVKLRASCFIAAAARVLRGPFRRAQMGTAHHFPDQSSALALARPRRDAPVPRIMLAWHRGQIRPRNRRADGRMKGFDTGTRHGVAPRVVVVEYPWRRGVTVGREAIAREEIAQPGRWSRCQACLTSLPTPGAAAVTSARHPEKPASRRVAGSSGRTAPCGC